MDSEILKGFEPIVVKCREVYTKPFISISPNKMYLYLNKAAIKPMEWEDGQRVDLLFKDNLFVLVPAKAGLYTLKVGKNGARINGKYFCIEILARAHAYKFDSWKENGFLYFKPMEEVEHE